MADNEQSKGYFEMLARLVRGEGSFPAFGVKGEERSGINVSDVKLGELKIERYRNGQRVVESDQTRII